MAKYEISHQCGHLVVHNIVGPDTVYRDGMTRRTWIARQRAGEPCSDCRGEQRAAQAEVLATAAADIGMPPLRGSAKQVVWAEQLRADALGELDTRLAPYSEDVAVPLRTLLHAAARRRDDAVWWIDNRFGGGLHGLLRELSSEEKDQVRAFQGRARDLDHEQEGTGDE